MNIAFYVSNAIFLGFCTLLLYLIIISINKWQLSNICQTCESNRMRRRVFGCLWLFGTCSFCDGDNFHYIKWIENANTRGIPDIYNSAEIIYQYFSYFTNESFILFRMFVWGGATSILSLTAKRLELSPRKVLLLIISLFIVTFCYARVTLAIVLYFYGFSYLIKPIHRRNILSCVVGLLIIYISSLFHRSAYLLIASTLILVVPKLGKGYRGWFMLTIYIVTAYIIVFYILNHFVEYIQIIGDMSVVDKYNKYAEKEVSIQGVGAGIYYFLQFVILWGATIACFINNRKYKESWVSYNLFKMSVALLLGSFIFRIIPDLIGGMAYRIQEMAMIPVTLYLCYSLTYYRFSYKKARALIIIGVISNIYKISYYFYLLMLGTGISQRLI